MSLEHLYTDTVNILRPTTAVNAIGQVLRTWPEIASSVSCEIQPRSQAYPQKEKGYVRAGMYVGFFELTVDIAKGDRLEYKDLFLDVTAVMEVRWNHYEVDLDEVPEDADTPTPSGS